MRLRILTVLLSLLALGGTAAAQDAPPPEGATEAAPAEGGDAMGGDMGAAEAAPAEAPAEEMPAEEVPADGGGKPISVGLLVGYGLDLETGPNAYGLGFGAGGGYTLDMGLYLGARFVYYLGDSMTFGTVTVDVNIWELGIEGGYDIAMDKLHIRPALGLGIAGFASGTALGSVTSTEFFIAPGAALLYDVSDSIYLGVDARLQLVLSDPMYKGLLLLANVGMRF